MKFRESEYVESGLTARWLDAAHAAHAYTYALQFSAKNRYGLSESTVEGSEHVDIHSFSVAAAWLKNRLPVDGTVQIVYSDDEVCVVPAAVFLMKWQDIFLPGRDDAIVLHNTGTGILFYCHEQELEFGHRRRNPASSQTCVTASA